MNPSPALLRFLAGMEYPATRDDLVREASRDGLDADDIAALHALDRGSFAARRQVLAALRTADVRELALA